MKIPAFLLLQRVARRLAVPFCLLPSLVWAGGADVKATLPTEDGGRIEFYMDGEVACFNKNDRPSMGPACKETVGDKALLLTAGRLEREGKEGIARGYYEALIRLYPNSETAVRANDRLMQLTDGDKTAARQQRQVEELRKIAEDNQRAEDARLEQAREEAERARREASYQRGRNCEAMGSSCYSGCVGLSTRSPSVFEFSPKRECERRCDEARRSCS